MARLCDQCQTWKSSSDYSSNQWRKGDGLSRCRSCVHGHGHVANSAVVYQYSCQECQSCFSNLNELNMHMQVHRPRNVACPLCGEGRFRSGANAVQHVESGFCTGCRGATNAREQIYKFASSQRAMQPYLSDVPRLTNGGNENAVPDFPYSCSKCSRPFKQLGHLLQHEESKHGSPPLLLQN